jgi:hypothetical protein
MEFLIPPLNRIYCQKKLWVKVCLRLRVVPIPPTKVDSEACVNCHRLRILWGLNQGLTYVL